MSASDWGGEEVEFSKLQHWKNLEDQMDEYRVTFTAYADEVRGGDCKEKDKQAQTEEAKKGTIGSYIRRGSSTDATTCS